MTGGIFPVGLTPLRLLTILPLSQAWHLGGLHRASPVPFRGSYFTPACIHRTLRPNDLLPACIGDGIFHPFHLRASWRTSTIIPLLALDVSKKLNWRESLSTLRRVHILPTARALASLSCILTKAALSPNTPKRESQGTILSRRYLSPAYLYKSTMDKGSGATSARMC